MVVADFDAEKLEREVTALRADGFRVIGVEVDVTSRSSVEALATAAAAEGRLRTVVHTAGLSPTMATAERVLEVDMLGTDHVLQAFGSRAVGGMVGDGLAFGAAYCIAKRVNQLRVEHAAPSWGANGARVVSISPGIISTAMGRQELELGSREAMEAQLAMAALPRMGTPEDIAAAVDWLASPAAAFVTGCDLRVDGGVTAAVLGLGLGLGPS